MTDSPPPVDTIAVILLAGGSGERLGAPRPKAFVGVGDRVMLAHSLQSFEDHEAVDSIVIVVPEDWVQPAEVLVDDLGCDRVSAVITGGASRAESVRLGLECLPDRAETAVLIHDAARPFVPEMVVNRVLMAVAKGADCAVPGLAVPDTIKEVGAGGVVERTPAREALRAVQTPQCVRASTMIGALRDLDAGQLEAITDDAAAVEAAGGRVVVVNGSPILRKVTDADDLEWARAQVAPAPEYSDEEE